MGSQTAAIYAGQPSLAAGRSNRWRTQIEPVLALALVAHADPLEQPIGLHVIGQHRPPGPRCRDASDTRSRHLRPDTIISAPRIIVWLLHWS